MPTADIAVVVGAQNAKSTISDCLDSVLKQVSGMKAEVLVADSSSDGTGSIVQKKYPGVKLITTKAGKLVPHLWGIGMELASAPIVAITTAHCIPADNWIRTIIEQSANKTDFAGLGGPIVPPNGESAKDWAIYFSRYSAFMPPAKAGQVADIPGDNAAYRKDALDKCWTDRENGFWETIFHNSLAKAGEKLYMSPDIEVSLGRTDSARDYFQTRFLHGVHYGSTRPNNKGPIKLMRICAAPILMPYLVLRIGKRVSQIRPDFMMHYMRAFPWLLYFMTGWALGEIQGYLNPQQHASL